MVREQLRRVCVCVMCACGVCVMCVCVCLFVCVCVWCVFELREAVRIGGVFLSVLLFCADKTNVVGICFFLFLLFLAPLEIHNWVELL